MQLRVLMCPNEEDRHFYFRSQIPLIVLLDFPQWPLEQTISSNLLYDELTAEKRENGRVGLDEEEDHGDEA